MVRTLEMNLSLKNQEDVLKTLYCLKTLTLLKCLYLDHMVPHKRLTVLVQDVDEKLIKNPH